MASEMVQQFDYSEFDADTRGKLIRLAGQIKRAAVDHVEKIFELGQRIAEAHDLLAGSGRDGAFAPWVQVECGFSRRTAYNFLNVFRQFGGKCEMLHTCSPTALYALASPETAEAARKEAIKLANKGHRLDLEEAKEIIEKFREKQKPAPKSKPAEPAKEAARSEGTEPTEKKPSGGTTFEPSEWETPAAELLDGLKQPVPKEFVSIFRQAEEFDVQRRRLSELKTWLKAMADKDGGFEIKKQLQQLTADANNLSTAIKFAQPHTICPYCHDKPGKVQKCEACHGNGWVTEAVYRAAPKEKKREAAAVSR